MYQSNQFLKGDASTCSGTTSYYDTITEPNECIESCKIILANFYINSNGYKICLAACDVNYPYIDKSTDKNNFECVAKHST